MSRPPETVVRAATAVLMHEPAHRRDEFVLRLERWWPDLLSGLVEVYGGSQATVYDASQAAAGIDSDAPLDDRLTALAVRVVTIAAAAYADRPAELARLDQVRILQPDWFCEPRMLGYAAYADRMAGDLVGVGERVEYLRELGVTYLHLMPLLQPRPGDSDGGYAVMDYRTVRSDLGTNENLRELAAQLRANGMSLVVDLVLNHVAAEHPWAVAARAGNQRYRGYFPIFDDRELPDAYERNLPEVFPDFAPGNFTFDEDLNGWVWTTFNSWQWDVDWSNPDVFCEYAEIILYLANLGVEVLRLDAVAFLWKRLGTNCQNQPEVHAITQALRAVARIAAPGVLFKAEAIVAPRDLVNYLGQGKHFGKVSDLAYHNSLMVQIWSMLAAGDVQLAAQALRELPPIPPTTTWMTYVRCHDDIGWAIDDADAAAVGLNGHAHRSFLSDYYSGQFYGSSARGLVFQFTPATGDRRISGTTASLAGLEAALEGGSTAEVDAAIARILLAHAMILGWGGVPVLWMGDEIGLLNDPDWAAEPGHEGDNRWAHRPRMDWDRAALHKDPTTVPGRLFGGIAALAAARARLEQLHGSVASEILAITDPGVLPVRRRHPLGDLVTLYNVTAIWRPVPLRILVELGIDRPYDAITATSLAAAEDGNLWLAPYRACWIVQSS
ncbi:alpha-amylase family protein [soil metagenome]